MEETTVKNFRWCKVVFQASKEHTVDIMEKYRAVHPHIKFDTLDERIAMFKSLNWLVPTTSDNSAYRVEGGACRSTKNKDSPVFRGIDNFLVRWLLKFSV